MLRHLIISSIQRSSEIRQAAAASPGMEIGAAYKKWKEDRGEAPPSLLTTADAVAVEAARALAAELSERPCTREGCAGTQRLESVCSGCIEGQAGYRTKWTCKICMHRDLSKETIDEWMLKLSSV